MLAYFQNLSFPDGASSLRCWATWWCFSLFFRDFRPVPWRTRSPVNCWWRWTVYARRSSSWPSWRRDKEGNRGRNWWLYRRRSRRCIAAEPPPKFSTCSPPFRSREKESWRRFFGKLCATAPRRSERRRRSIPTWSSGRFDPKSKFPLKSWLF